MAKVIELTSVDDKRVWVNLENMAYMTEWHDGSTVLYFCGGQGDRFLTLTVKEAPNRILIGL